MKSPLDIIVNGASQDDVIFLLCLLQVAQWTNPIWVREVIINIDLESMRAQFELTKGNPEGVHVVLAYACRLDNKSICQL